MRTSLPSRSRPARFAQSGLALLVTLIVLVAMTLAGIALVRSVDTAVMIAGNLAFRQGATTAGDAGVEAALGSMMGNKASLASDSPSLGYYSTSQDSLDLTGNRTTSTSDNFDWDGGGAIKPHCLATDAAGNTVCYIVHRLCAATGPLDASKCATKQAKMGGSSLGAVRPMETYQERAWTEAAVSGYFRVTVRVAGPRNNVSFIQSFVII
jgi:type IV pilus assembly protein PilX